MEQEMSRLQAEEETGVDIPVSTAPTQPCDTTSQPRSTPDQEAPLRSAAHDGRETPLDIRGHTPPQEQGHTPNDLQPMQTGSAPVEPRGMDSLPILTSPSPPDADQQARRAILEQMAHQQQQQAEAAEELARLTRLLDCSQGT